MDGAALVHMLLPGASKTFRDYGNTILGPYIDRLLQTFQRIDKVFDRYLTNSLKVQTSEFHRSDQ